MESAFNTNLLVGANLKIETREYIDEFDEKIDGKLDIHVKGNGKIAVGQGNVEEAYRFDLNTIGDNLFTATENTDILSVNGNHTETAVRIDMNGPQASTAELADVITDLTTHGNAVTNNDLDYAQSRFQEFYQLNSIMKRIPMHEPWALHENLLPTLLKPKNTDRED
jgi:hypothetical protein